MVTAQGRRDCRDFYQQVYLTLGRDRGIVKRHRAPAETSPQCLTVEAHERIERLPQFYGILPACSPSTWRRR